MQRKEGGGGRGKAKNKRKKVYTHIGARIRRCSSTGFQTPGEAGPATPTSGSREEEPSRDERCTWRVLVADCCCLTGKNFRKRRGKIPLRQRHGPTTMIGDEE